MGKLFTKCAKRADRETFWAEAIALGDQDWRAVAIQNAGMKRFNIIEATDEDFSGFNSFFSKERIKNIATQFSTIDSKHFLEKNSA